MLTGEGSGKATTRCCSPATPLRPPDPGPQLGAAEQAHLQQRQVSDHFAIIPDHRRRPSTSTRLEQKLYDFVVQPLPVRSSSRPPNTWSPPAITRVAGPPFKTEGKVLVDLRLAPPSTASEGQDGDGRQPG